MVLSTATTKGDNQLSLDAGNEQGFSLEWGGTSYSTTFLVDHSSGVASKTVPTAGAVTSPTWLEAGVADVWAALTIALRPVVSVGVTIVAVPVTLHIETPSRTFAALQIIVDNPISSSLLNTSPGAVTALIAVAPIPTVVTVEQLIRDTYQLSVTKGVELWDNNLNFIEDITDDVRDWAIEHNNFRSVHGTIKLHLSRELQWSSQVLHPYLILDDTLGNTHRWEYGAFTLDTPVRKLFEVPQEFVVKGFDLLDWLRSPIGSSYKVAAGTGYIAAVESILSSLGHIYGIDQASASAQLAIDRVWPIDSNNTWLKVVNTLLGAISYRSLYVDRSGIFRSEPRIVESELPSMWTYDTSIDHTIVAEDVAYTIDLYNVPNRWVFVNYDPESTTQPSEGNGLYTVVNQSDGPASIDSRGGRTKTKIYKLEDVRNQSSLVSRGNRIVEDTKFPLNRIDMSIGINPLHWHWDAATLNMPRLGIASIKFTIHSWKVNFWGEDMQLKLRSLT